MAHVDEVNEIDQLAGYRLLWDSLLPATPRASFFHTIDWLERYWNHFGHDQKLRVLIISSQDRPIGIVPLCVRTMRYRVGTVRALGYPLDDWGMWYGPIGPNQAASMMMAMQHIRHTRRDWDMIDLRWCDNQGERAGRALRVAGLEAAKTEYQTNSVIAGRNWEEFLAGKSCKNRHEFRRKLRRVSERDDIEIIRHRPAPTSAGDGDPRWDLYDTCVDVAAASWQNEVKSGNTLSHDRVRPFLREAHQAAAARGMVDMNLLLAGGRPVAFSYNYHYQRRVFGLRTGFVRSAAGDGLGMALLLSSIQQSLDGGDQSIDLGTGAWEYKRRLRTHTETSYQFTHTPLANLRSQAVRLTSWVKQRYARPRAASLEPAAV